MTDFINYYKALDLNKRINLKGVGAMLNPWFKDLHCPYIGKIKSLQALDITFARVLETETITWTSAGQRIFFTIDWNHPTRPAFELLNRTCKNHFKKSHSMYPANSFEYLNIGTCNH